MITTHLALVVESPSVQAREATEVAAVLQRQVSRDFAPLWGVDGTVDVFHALEDVPPGYWIVLVRSDFAIEGLIGIHLDNRGQPFSLVRDVPNWHYIASHEVLEMLADPFGSRLVPGGSLKPGQGLVEYLVEVCDPCASPEFGYTVNGLLVSDFVTPAYYGPAAVPGGRYSFSGAVDQPREVLRDGYVSWQDPTNREWWRADRVGRKDLRFTSLGRQTRFDGRPLRERVDGSAGLSLLADGIPDSDPAIQVANVIRARTKAASLAIAEDLRARIGEMANRSSREDGGEQFSSGRDPILPLDPDDLLKIKKVKKRK